VPRPRHPCGPTPSDAVAPPYGRAVFADTRRALTELEPQLASSAPPPGVTAAATEILVADRRRAENVIHEAARGARVHVHRRCTRVCEQLLAVDRQNGRRVAAALVRDREHGRARLRGGQRPRVAGSPEPGCFRVRRRQVRGRDRRQLAVVGQSLLVDDVRARAGRGLQSRQRGHSRGREHVGASATAVDRLRRPGRADHRHRTGVIRRQRQLWPTPAGS
jgi:hypothetical protein